MTAPPPAIKLAQMFHDDETLAAVERVLESGRFIRGSENKAFEEEFARYVGTRHCVMVANGTLAIEAALMALGIGPGDEVVVPGFSFVATATPVLHLGAKPVFVDVRAEDYCLDAEAVAARATPCTKAIIPVHLFGQAADMGPILDLAEERGILVLEDACQAHGAVYHGKRVGTLGDAAAFSFFPSKNMTVAGDGGAIATDDADHAEKVRSISDAGRAPGQPYTHVRLGLNFRLNEIQCAIGRVQLKHVEAWNEKRRANATAHAKALGGIQGLGLPAERAGNRHVWHQYVVRTPKRDALQQHLRERGIESAVHYPTGIHQQAFVQSVDKLPETEKACKEVLSIPVHPHLTPAQLEAIHAAVRGFFHA